MTLTAVVTNYDYAKYLPHCIESALMYCDEVLVYDDGSTDDSLEVLARYPVEVTHRDDASGCPVWGSNLGIKDATSTHIVFLDADNYLLGPVPQRDVDYLFAAIEVVDDDENPIKRWSWPARPLDAVACWDRFVDRAARGSYEMPFPWGGVWRTKFLRDKSWRRFDTTAFAADYRTALDWCKAFPTLAYSAAPFLAFRKHAGQWSQSPEKPKMQAEVARIARSETMPATGGTSVVYVFKGGKSDELRYSLRSLRNIEHGDVWMVGGAAPTWAQGVRHIGVDHRINKWRHTTDSVRAACEDQRISDPFILMNDDFYIMQSIGEIPALHAGAMPEVMKGYDERGNSSSRYFAKMQHTDAILKSLGFDDAVSYDLHVPIVVHKAQMIKALDIIDAAGMDGAHKRTLYGNIAAIGGERIDDVKLYDATMPIPQGPFASSLDGKPFEKMLPVLRYLFPEPSRYERAEPQPEMVNGIKYPVCIKHDCTLDGVLYPKDSKVYRETALALKAAGQLHDPRIV